MGASLDCRRVQYRQPCIVPAGGDAQHLAHRGYGISCLVGFHKLEDSGGIEPVSRANQAAAFPEKASGRCARISRSRRSFLPKVSSQTGNFLALGSGEPVVATTLVQIGSLSPVANRHRRGFKLAGELLRAANRSDQLDDLLPILWRVAKHALWARVDVFWAS